jgi:hypothetical protein
VEQKGCVSGVLELCLYEITFAPVHIEKDILRSTADLIYNHRRVKHLQKTAAYISTIRDDYPSDVYDQLAEASSLITKAAVSMDRMTDVWISNHGAMRIDLPLLAEYVKRSAGNYHFKQLAALVRIAAEPGDAETDYSPGTITQAVGRFRRTYPPVWMALKAAVSDWHELRPRNVGEFHCCVESRLEFGEFGQIEYSKPPINVRDIRAGNRYLAGYKARFPRSFRQTQRLFAKELNGTQNENQNASIPKRPNNPSQQRGA